ncbi:DUF2254 domain-containing protein [Pirellulimonas nuda]|nr:DUF2254 domain-containing protein [Pirellulimonas nuda]
MRILLLKWWDLLRSSFWFVPSLMAAGSVALAVAMVALDDAVSDEWLIDGGWAYTGGAEGASAVLSAIASSMMGIAGVVFSMTLVALSLASSQFGPRLLRNFMRDSTNQVVLGTFVATFMYSLLVLRTIRYGDESVVPHLSVTLAVGLALMSLGVLIYFIHHVSVSIQADEVVSRVGDELLQSIDRMFPEPEPPDDSTPQPAPDSPALDAAFDEQSQGISADVDGYLQFIDLAALTALATKNDAILRVERRPGEYLAPGARLLSVWPRDRASEDLVGSARAAFGLGSQRTPSQDLEFTVDQLVEVAVRALSPGINDPFTAIRCIDRLGSALCRFAKRDPPSPHRFDADGRLRVTAPPVSFSRFLDCAFDPIRNYARADAQVTRRLLETIATVEKSASRPERRAALRRHADVIAAEAQTGLSAEADRRTIALLHEQVIAALNEGESPPPEGESVV